MPRLVLFYLYYTAAFFFFFFVSFKSSKDYSTVQPQLDNNTTMD